MLAAADGGADDVELDGSSFQITCRAGGAGGGPRGDRGRGLRGRVRRADDGPEDDGRGRRREHGEEDPAPDRRARGERRRPGRLRELRHPRAGARDVAASRPAPIRGHDPDRKPMAQHGRRRGSIDSGSDPTCPRRTCGGFRRCIHRSGQESSDRRLTSPRESPRHRPRNGCVRVRDRPRKRRAPQGHCPRVLEHAAPGSARSCGCKTIFDGVAGLIAEHAPDAVALEESYVGADARIALSVGQARGAVLVACASAGVAARVRARPRQAGRLRLRPRRQGAGAAHGEARSSGSTVADADHAADALAVAICHALAPPLLRVAA